MECSWNLDVLYKIYFSSAHGICSSFQQWILVNKPRSETPSIFWLIPSTRALAGSLPLNLKELWCWNQSSATVYSSICILRELHDDCTSGKWRSTEHGTSINVEKCKIKIKSLKSTETYDYNHNPTRKNHKLTLMRGVTRSSMTGASNYSNVADIGSFPPTLFGFGAHTLLETVLEILLDLW